MANKDTLVIPQEIISSRLNVLFEDLNNYYQSNNQSLESELISLYNEALELFVASIQDFNLKDLVSIKKGLPANPEEYNIFTSLIQKNLLSIFAEIASLDRLVASSFNSISLEKEQVVQTIKRVSNKVGDYLLYADPNLGAGYFFGDSFNTTNHIDSHSSLIEGDECLQSIEEGSILLPLNGTPDIPKIKKTIINISSNGEPGNNYQLNQSGHSSIEVLFDQEPNTWFEYEKVVSIEQKKPLILDITICLEEISVVNYININPINFGTPTVLEISVIETSKDGKEYISIKDEVSVKDFVAEDEENIFELSASSSNCSGQGYYSFLPRKTQYVHIVFKQTTPYTIETINGDRLRYAIGIRDINIFGRKFKSSGSIVSTIFSSPKEIRKVSLFASENPIEESSLADISHFISHDDGGTWTQIQPQNRSFFNIPEIINFNTIDENSINTDSAIYNLRHKISMNRNKEVFSGEQIIKESLVDTFDSINLPSGTSSKITLNNTPVKDSVSVVVPFLGSYSCPRERAGTSVARESTILDLDSLDFTIDASDNETIKYSLPFKNISNLEHKIRVFVNGAQIEYLPKMNSAFSSGGLTSYTSIDSDSKVYYLNKSGREIQFGYKDSSGIQRGFVPDAGTKISICLDGDNPQLELIDGKYLLNLSSFADGNIETTYLYSLKSIDENNYYQQEYEIPSGVYYFTPDEVTSIDDSIPYFIEGIDNFEIKEFDLTGNLITGSDRQYETKVEFVDGFSELRDTFGDPNAGYYCFNNKTGTVYFGSEVPSDRKVTLISKILDIVNIPNTSWKFKKDIVSNKIDTKLIEVDASNIFTSKQIVSVIYSIDNQRSISLLSNNSLGHSWYNKRIVKGTVKPSLSLFLNSTKPTEVKYINGSKEFSKTKLVEKESISFSNVDTNIWEFSLQQIDNENKILIGSPSFSAIRAEGSTLSPTNIFEINGQQDSFDNLSSNGQWAVERTGEIYYVRVYYSSTPDNHIVSYKYDDLDSGLDNTGLYSIDYQNSALYLATPIQNNGTVSFEVSIYSAFYNIAETINPKYITVKDKELQFDNNFSISLLKEKVSEKLRPKIGKVYYSYYETSSESLADIEPYFSPICKDIAFRVVDSSILEEL